MTDEPTAKSPANSSIATEEPVKALLAEVNVLAVRLKQLERQSTDEESTPVGGHGVLEVLDTLGSLTVPQIARLRSSSRQNIQILANRLEREGCIQFVPNPA